MCLSIVIPRGRSSCPPSERWGVGTRLSLVLIASYSHFGLHLIRFSPIHWVEQLWSILLCVLKIKSIMLSAALLIWSRPWMIRIQWSSTSPRYVEVIELIVTPELLSFPGLPLNPGVLMGSLLWSRKALTRLTMGEILLLNWEISEVRTYNKVVCLRLELLSTRSSRSPIASWYAVAIGIAWSMMASIML